MRRNFAFAAASDGRFKWPPYVFICDLPAASVNPAAIDFILPSALSVRGQTYDPR